MSAEFELVLFCVDPEFIREAVAAGVAAIIVDWEHLGKEERQKGADTEINRHTVDDLRRVRQCTHARVLCRLNPPHPNTPREIEAAIAAGAEEIMVPMVRSPDEVMWVLRLTRERCGVGILVETVQAVHCAAQLGRLPLSRVYVGLNDLAIERGTPNIFTALVDGTLERVRACFLDTPFGFGGLTLPDKGHPIPCRLLIGEMVRLGCRFSFLRRSFHRDIKGRNLAVEVPRILSALHAATMRSPAEVEGDRQALYALVQAWNAKAAPTNEVVASCTT
ncbi:hypothetical protein HRbin17_01678 [bacterium HR17]|uniref:HpcH/HpaI aldolase/citrate lyase domain-containing protein n=1 Tax=Candidatus Fervidibacter japonicus TaxID=2035412 RepID=A0A2H5XDE5_9BACT|nr:hypothetical protein HRbin17_01678 [bacterium HR17]